MKRKVVNLGGSCLVVSLPSKWVKKYGVKKGDELEIEENNNTLNISSDLKGLFDKSKSIKLDLSAEDKRVIKTILRNLYRVGYEQIELKFKDKKVLDEINKTLDTYLGLEIVTSTNNSCIIDNIAEPSSKKVENLINRMFFTIIDSFDILIEEVESKNLKSINLIEQRTKSIDKLYNFCLRINSKEKVQKDTQIPLIQMYTYFTLLGHSFYHLYENVDTKLEYNMYIELVKELKERFYKIFKGFKDHKITILTDEMKPLADFLYSKGLIEINKNRGKNIFLYYVCEMSRYIYMIGSCCVGVLSAELN